MIRLSLVLVAALFFNTVTFSATDYKVKVSQNYPRVVKPGDSFTMTFLIEKSDVTGFARLQQNLPGGFTAELIEAHGAEFVFSDSTVKFSWIELPAETSFTVSYKIKTGKDMYGSEIIKGAFVYMDGGRSQNIFITPAVVNLENIIIGNEPLPEVKRHISAMNAEKNEYKVELTIHPNGIHESARFTDSIPENYIAEMIDAHGSVFSFTNRTAIFDWTELPDEQSFTISYKVKTEKTNSPSPAISGVLLFGDDVVPTENETVKETLKSEDFAENKNETSTPPAPVNEKTETAPAPVNTSENTTEAKQPVAQLKEEPAPVVPQQPPVISSGIVFRVQISATRRSSIKDSKWFDEKYKIDSDVELTQHEGWKKYLIGNFKDYKEAKSLKNQTLDKISDAFVVAYRDGVRISVDDALRSSATLNQNSVTPSVTYNPVSK